MPITIRAQAAPVPPRPAPGGIDPLVDQLLDYRPFQPRHYANAAALALSGTPVRLADGSPLSVTPVSGTALRVAVGSNAFDLEVGAGVDTRAVLSSLLEYYLQTPPVARGVLERVKVEAGSGDPASWWDWLTRPQPMLTYARGGNGTLTFYGGTAHLDAATFHHELGHLLGAALPGHVGAHPAGWPAANQADGRSVSAYARTNWEENFAEFWRCYVQSGGKLRDRYPAQTALLESALDSLQQV
jgi:hypothetical protein